MNELERYLAWVLARVDTDERVHEEPDLELKERYKDLPEKEALWELSDLLAALANDARADGYRALVYGPSKDLQRPNWLADEARLRDKLLRHFEGGVVPTVEVVRRDIPGRGTIDAFVIVEHAATPYVTRLQHGGAWVVRVRTNTARRTATRAEIIALAKGPGTSRSPVRQLDARLAPLSADMRKIVVTNTGTVSVANIRVELPADAATGLIDDRDPAIDLLHPGERDNIAILRPGGMMGSDGRSDRVRIHGIAGDGEPVETSVLVSTYD